MGNSFGHKLCEHLANQTVTALQYIGVQEYENPDTTQYRSPTEEGIVADLMYELRNLTDWADSDKPLRIAGEVGTHGLLKYCGVNRQSILNNVPNGRFDLVVWRGRRTKIPFAIIEVKSHFGGMGLQNDGKRINKVARLVKKMNGRQRPTHPHGVLVQYMVKPRKSDVLSGQYNQGLQESSVDRFFNRLKKDMNAVIVAPPEDVVKVPRWKAGNRISNVFGAAYSVLWHP